TFAQRVEEVLEGAPEVKRAWRRPAATLSGGEQKLLALCRILVQEAHILIVDEPTAGLSEMYAQRIWEWLKVLAADDMAIIVVEQNVRLLLTSADWIHVLVGGRTSASAAAEDIKTQNLA